MISMLGANATSIADRIWFDDLRLDWCGLFLHWRKCESSYSCSLLKPSLTFAGWMACPTRLADNFSTCTPYRRLVLT
jgi:hypothetical protein